MFQEENGYRRATADSSVTHNSTPMMKGEDEGRGWREMMEGTSLLIPFTAE